jgi:thiol-disulfide isomerase/thioredoxin
VRPTLTVLSREYCHLCEELITALKRFQGRYDFDIEVVDVDSRPELEEKWGDKVPVLLDGNLEICHYFLDHDAVDARLARIK